jgi:hypothetical protein
LQNSFGTFQQQSKANISAGIMDSPNNLTATVITTRERHFDETGFKLNIPNLIVLFVWIAVAFFVNHLTVEP